MRPSRLTRQQCDIYHLAFEFRTLGAKAMDHTAQRSFSGKVATDMPSTVQWAIDYISQIPPAGFALIDMAHRDAELSPSEARRCGFYLGLFYARLKKRMLLGMGKRYLEMLGS